MTNLFSFFLFKTSIFKIMTFALPIYIYIYIYIYITVRSNKVLKFLVVREGMFFKTKETKLKVWMQK